MAEEVTVTATFDAPVERVWELIMDPHRLGEWVSIHDSVEGAPEGGLEQGSTFTQTLKRLTFEFEVRWKVVEIERPHRARWEGTGPGGSSASVVYELSETAEGGTSFDYTNCFELPGGKLGAAASKVFGAKAASKLARKSLKRLDKRLERGDG